MHLLRRAVRFSINPTGTERLGSNGTGGVPASLGLGPWYELDIACRGEPDPATGYLIDIKTIDRAVRHRAIPVVERFARTSPQVSPSVVLRQIVAGLAHVLPITSARLRVTPTYSLEIFAMNPSVVLLRQQFEFAASHRLHASQLTDEENRELYGKCNNPNGHGHNYKIEPQVALRIDDDAALRFGLPQLERIVEEVLIERFDHKHLNLDTREFADDGGVIPSVENIARVCHDLLAPRIAEASSAATLRSITVWETDRTCATFPG